MERQWSNYQQAIFADVANGDGNTVVEVFEENVTRGDRITITHPDTGEVVVEFDDLAFEQAWQAVYRKSEVGPRPERPEVSIVISEDGTNWTVLPVEDSGFHPSAIALGNGAMLLVGWSESGGLFGLGGQRPQLYLVHSG